MNERSDDYLEFIALVDGYASGSLEASGMDELRRRLREDERARDWFRQYHEFAVVMAARQRTAAVPTPVPIVRRPSVRRLSGPRVAAAALLVIAGIAVYAVVLSLYRPAPESVDMPIATLIDATGTVIVNDDIANPGENYRPGEYSIAEGTAEFHLVSGASFTLVGESSIVVHHGMAASLRAGRAEFNCPPTAVGYTVYLPGDGKVVDLGTQFAVEIADDGAPEVRVTEGHVQLHGADRVIDITANRGWRIDPVAGLTPVAIEIPLVNADFESPALPDFEGRHHKPVDDWRRVGIGLVSVYNPDHQFYPHSRASDPDGGVLPGMSGPQALFMFGVAVGHAEQTTDHPIKPGERYELTVAVGRRSDIRNVRRAPGSIELRAGDSLLARADLPPESDQPIGTFVDFSLSWTPEPNDPAIGQPLTVRLARSATREMAYVDIDNVRLAHRPAPIDPSPPTPAQGDQP